MTPTTLLPPSKRVLALDWQKEVSDTIAQRLANGESSYLQGPTGCGKMYMTAQAVYDSLASGSISKYEASILPTPVLWLCPKIVKADTAETLALYRLTTQVMLLSYSELSSSVGEALYLAWINDAVSGAKTPIWRIDRLPMLVVCDEAHWLKNPESLRSRIIRALPANVKLIFASATPFQRVGDAQTMAEVFRIVTRYNTVPASNATGRRIMQDIAYPKSPEDYSPSASERLGDAIAPYMVKPRNIKFKFKAKSECIQIFFRDAKERHAYNTLVNTLIENLQKKRQSNGELRTIDILAERQKMQQGAELLRVPHLCERAAAKLPTRAVIIAANFTDTIKSCYQTLVEIHGIDPKRIAVIRGEGSEHPAGSNKKNQNKLQSGECDILLINIKIAIGISVHHDRPTTKPRSMLLTITWSGIDIAQTLGRGHRLTSMSPTELELLWYAETIEEEIKVVVEKKVKCLDKAIKAKEQISDVFIKQIATKLAVKIDEEELAAEEMREYENTEVGDDSVVDDRLGFTGEGLSNEEEVLAS